MFVYMNKKTEMVNISKIVVGDTVIYNAHERTINKNHIKDDPFMGRTLFGDSYRLGTILVEKVIFKKVK